MEQLIEREVVVVVCSGGLDSTVALYDALDKGYQAKVLSFNYGQRHSKELVYATHTCDKLKLGHAIVNLPTFLASTLTGVGEIPEGHYAAENMSQTVVPNRNAIMLSVAYGYALSIRAVAVVIGAHAGDHPIYPDCRHEFFWALEEAFRLGADSNIIIETPFIDSSKADIVKRGAELNIDFRETWSCYKGSTLHCGRCGTCVERAEAFSLAGVPDPTIYEDKNYWKQAVAQNG